MQQTGISSEPKGSRKKKKERERQSFKSLFKRNSNT